MKKTILNLGFILLAALVMCSCEDKSVPKSFIGKWDMTNDRESSIQKNIEIKEGNTFIETWTVYDDDGELYGELEISGRCEFMETKGEGYLKSHALCLVYDLKSLSDPEGILEALEMEDYFKKENDSYESAKRQDKAYGLQKAHVKDSKLIYDGGELQLIDEVMEKLMEERKNVQKNDENNNSSTQSREELPHLLTVANVEYWDNVKDQGSNTYGPNNMLDGNPSTAWAVNLEKASYDGDKLYGPIFTLRCKKLSHIVINNGYAKSDEAYKNNARASHIIFCNADNVSDEDEQASYLFEGILKDTPDKQTLNIDPNLSCNNDIKKIQLIISIDGLRHGTKWNDLCVSEIEFWGY